MIPAFGLRVCVLLDANGANTTAAAAVRVAAQAPRSGRHARPSSWAAPGRSASASGCCWPGRGPRSASPRASSTAPRPPPRRSASACPARRSTAVAVAGDADLRRRCGGPAAHHRRRGRGRRAAARLGPRRLCSDLQVAIDLNAVPPLGIEGVEVTDAADERDGVDLLRRHRRRRHEDEAPPRRRREAVREQRPGARRRTGLRAGRGDVTQSASAAAIRCRTTSTSSGCRPSGSARRNSTCGKLRRQAVARLRSGRGGRGRRPTGSTAPARPARARRRRTVGRPRRCRAPPVPETTRRRRVVAPAAARRGGAGRRWRPAWRLPWAIRSRAVVTKFVLRVRARGGLSIRNCRRQRAASEP